MFFQFMIKEFLKLIGLLVLASPGEDGSIPLKNCISPQQENGYDCGVYVLAIANLICQMAAEGTLSTHKLGNEVLKVITPSYVSLFRKKIAFLIESMSSDS